MRHNTKIAHVIVAAIFTMCTTGSAMAAEVGLRTEVTALQGSFAELNSQVQVLQLNQDVNIVEFAAYVGDLLFVQYFVELNQINEGCQVFVADERVLSAITSAVTTTILMDPQELLALAGVPTNFGLPVMIPLNVECSSGEKGHVTGMVFPNQALPRDGLL